MKEYGNNKKVFLCNSAVIFLFSFLLFLSPLYAQEEAQTEFALSESEHKQDLQTQDGIARTDEETEELEFLEIHNRLSRSERQRIEMEIRTSTLSELALWCRTLGLSEGGTRNDLSSRIRNHFSLPEGGSHISENQKVITIESAQTTEYFTIDIIDEDYARLKGDVSITLKDGDTTHKISASEILFNRTRNIITAKGGVVYEKIDADKTETFRGENITVNIDNWSSVFLDGKSKLDSGDSAYLFSGLVISRTADDVTILRDAQVTSGTSDETFWSISASRIWLLPGSDFAIFNAVLKVGEIPVLYIPFFFFPTDELIFHPVVGYRTREGGFVQTTTYILGRPKADAAETNSLSKILGNSNDMQKERQGVFLRSTGKKYVPTTEISLKALVDYYVNLGAFIGLDLSLPKTGILNPLELSFGLGFTRTVTDTNRTSGPSMGYSPYWPNYDGSSDWNKSNLFSIQVPFRYKLKTSSSISGKFGTISWSFPFYSDPFIESDFNKRSESMDWVNMLQQEATIDDPLSSDKETGSYQWHIYGNLTPSFTAFAPYISRISITNISMTLGFKPFRDSNVVLTNPFSPSRSFYGPDKFTLYSVSGSVTGNPLSLGAKAAVKKTQEQIEFDNPLKGIGVPIPPWESQNTEKQERNTSTDILRPPEIRQTFSLPKAGNINFSIDYQLAPTSSSELQFMNLNWKAYEDVNWNDVQSILTSISGKADLNFRMDHSTGLFSNIFSFSGTGTWREFSYLNEEAYTNPNDGTVDETKMEEARKQQYSQTNYSSSYSYTGSVKPFLNNQIFGQSNIQYSFRGTLVRSKKYTNGNGPELTPQWGSWVKERRVDGEDILGLNSHQLSANVAANIMNRNQSFSLTTTLPPLDELISTNATLRFWISETNASFRMERKPIDNDEDNKKWFFRPIDLRETLKFGNVGSLLFSMTIDPESNNEITTLRTELSLKSFRINFLANKLIKSVFVPNPGGSGGKWEQEGEAALYPNNLSLSYTKQFNTINLISNRLNFNFRINTRLTFDMQKYTSSYFEITFDFGLKVTNFLDVTLSVRSDNSVLFRYFKDVPGMENLTFMYIDGPQNNLFIDFFDSFNFFDESKRRRSGFKMQSLGLKIDHNLGDWTATLRLTMYPFQRQTGATTTINIISDISFIVQWTPITEIKSDIDYDGRRERWTVKK
ncbi:MAG: LPS-assembly protein LptD [Treponema sp.]|nr:LPS-assembly protein LptD [Treponema sp.]